MILKFKDPTKTIEADIPDECTIAEVKEILTKKTGSPAQAMLLCLHLKDNEVIKNYPITKNTELRSEVSLIANKSDLPDSASIAKYSDEIPEQFVLKARAPNNQIFDISVTNLDFIYSVKQKVASAIKFKTNFLGLYLDLADDQKLSSYGISPESQLNLWYQQNRSSSTSTDNNSATTGLSVSSPRTESLANELGSLHISSPQTQKNASRVVAPVSLPSAIESRDSVTTAGSDESEIRSPLFIDVGEQHMASMDGELSGSTNSLIPTASDEKADVSPSKAAGSVPTGTEAGETIPDALPDYSAQSQEELPDYIERDTNQVVEYTSTGLDTGGILADIAQRSSFKDEQCYSATIWYNNIPQFYKIPKFASEDDVVRQLSFYTHYETLVFDSNIIVHKSSKAHEWHLDENPNIIVVKSNVQNILGLRYILPSEKKIVETTESPFNTFKCDSVTKLLRPKVDYQWMFHGTPVSPSCIIREMPSLASTAHDVFVIPRLESRVSCTLVLFNNAYKSKQFMVSLDEPLINVLEEFYNSFTISEQLNNLSLFHKTTKIMPSDSLRKVFGSPFDCYLVVVPQSELRKNQSI